MHKIRGPECRQPKSYNPYFGDPHKGTPNFGKPPFRVDSVGLRVNSLGLLSFFCSSPAPLGLLKIHMGGCQNYGPFLDPYYNTAPSI